MPVTKRRMAPGDFEIQLDDDVLPVPYSLTDRYDLETGGFGHILIVPSRVRPDVHTDAQMLAMSVFTGVLRTVEDRTRLRGSHVNTWLGDEDGKGYVLEVAVTKAAGTFAQWITDLQPPTVTLGTLGAPAGTLNWSAYLKSRREAIDYVCDYFGCEWQVTDDLVLNADTAANLYGAAPSVIATPWWNGRDNELTAIRCRFTSPKTVEDYTTRVVAKDAAGALGGATVGATPYKDGLGNAVQIKRYVDGGQDVTAGTGNAYAAGQLARWDQVDTRVTCRTDAFCPMADVPVGSSMWVYDPDRDLFDTANEVHYAGRILWPTTLTVDGITMQVREGMAVLFRDGDGVYTDLSDHVRWEQGESTLHVGAPRPTLARAVRGHHIRA